MKVLGQSKDGLPSDKILCHWVQLQKLTDEMVAQVPLDDAGSTSAAKIRNAYKDFEREMKAWEGRVLSNVTSCESSLLSSNPKDRYGDQSIIHIADFFSATVIGLSHGQPLHA